jgi:tRNA pseudouridine55 synthase
MIEATSGLLLLDKPSGPTSFECVRQARRILGQRRIGHCGTLDPIAQGVLILVFGQYTRKQDEFLAAANWAAARIRRTGPASPRIRNRLTM